MSGKQQDRPAGWAAEVSVRNDAEDRALLERMAKGDSEALATLYRAYHGRLCRFLYRLTRHTDLIEEVINDCFWIAWQKAADFRGDSRVSTWLMGIAYRCGLKTLRKYGNGSMRFETLTDQEPGIDPEQDREMRDLLDKGMQHLNTDQRAVIELVYGVGHSLDEVAEIMQCPVGTVKARLFHARVKLRNAMPALVGDDSARRNETP